MSAIRVPGAKIALSTASVYPERTPDAFELAARLGYDGVEIMVGADPVSQDVDVLRAAVRPLPAADAGHPRAMPARHPAGLGPRPVGQASRRRRRPSGSGARTVVVHPPFRWQRDYARDFEAASARMRDETGRGLRGGEHVPAEGQGQRGRTATRPTGTRSTTTSRTSRSTCRTRRSPGPTPWRWPTKLGDRLAHLHLADGLGVRTRTSTWFPAGATSRAPRSWSGWRATATAGWSCWRSTRARPPAVRSGSTTSPRPSPSRACTSPRRPTCEAATRESRRVRSSDAEGR